jgi:transposase
MEPLRSDPWPIDGESRRLDVVDLGRRRRFSDAYKHAVVAESYRPGVVVAEIARRCGLRPGQIYQWRSQLGASKPGRRPLERHGDDPRTLEVPAFVPVVAAPDGVGPSATASPLVVVLGTGTRIEVMPGFDATTLAEVVRTLEGLR